MANFFQVAYKRLKTESPLFFKKIRNAGNSLMVLGTTCTASQIVPNVKMPPILTTIGTHAIVAGFIMTLVASLTVNDPSQINKDNTPKS